MPCGNTSVKTRVDRAQWAVLPEMVVRYSAPATAVPATATAPMPMADAKAGEGRPNRPRSASTNATDQPRITHTNIPAGEPHHIVYPNVEASRCVVGVVAATAASAAHSARAMSAPAHKSARRRSSPTAATASSAHSISRQDQLPSVLGAVRTSAFLSHGERGLFSHHGGTPMARTTARHPTVAPSVDFVAVAVLTTAVRLPGCRSI